MHYYLVARFLHIAKKVAIIATFLYNLSNKWHYFAKPFVSTSNTSVEFEGIVAPLPRTP